MRKVPQPAASEASREKGCTYRLGLISCAAASISQILTCRFTPILANYEGNCASSGTAGLILGYSIDEANEGVVVLLDSFNQLEGTHLRTLRTAQPSMLMGLLLYLVHGPFMSSAVAKPKYIGSATLESGRSWEDAE